MIFTRHFEQGRGFQLSDLTVFFFNDFLYLSELLNILMSFHVVCKCLSICLSGFSPFWWSFSSSEIPLFMHIPVAYWNEFANLVHFSNSFMCL